MSNLYLVNQDNPHAISMARKLINSKKENCYIPCSKQEHQALIDKDVYELPEKKSESNPYVDIVEIDDNKKYLAFCKIGYITQHQVDRLNQIPNIKVILTH